MPESSANYPSPVPGLTELGCNENQLTELDLSPVPGLTKLGCRNNQLTKLDLSVVPGLMELWCYETNSPSWTYRH